MGKIGDMSRRVEVLNPVTTRSTMGAPQKSWAHFCYMTTSRVVVGESPEAYINSRLVIAPRYKYKAHYFISIDETMRIVDDSIIYNVLSVNPDPEDSLFIEILVEKVTE